MFGIVSSRSTQIKAALQEILRRRKERTEGHAPVSLKLDFYNAVNTGNYEEALRLGEEILGMQVV